MFGFGKKKTSNTERTTEIFFAAMEEAHRLKTEGLNEPQNEHEKLMVKIVDDLVKLREIMIAEHEKEKQNK